MSVDFEPKVITMSAPNIEAGEGSITIQNNNSHNIKFKVKVTESQLFVAKPNNGVINAGCVQIVIFRYRPPVIDFPKNPKSQIQYIVLDDIQDDENLFEKYADDKVQHRNFRIIFPVSLQSFGNIDKIIGTIENETKSS